MNIVKYIIQKCLESDRLDSLTLSSQFTLDVIPSRMIVKEMLKDKLQPIFVKNQRAVNFWI